MQRVCSSNLDVGHRVNNIRIFGTIRGIRSRLSEDIRDHKGGTSTSLSRRMYSSLTEVSGLVWGLGGCGGAQGLGFRVLGFRV